MVVLRHKVGLDIDEIVTAISYGVGQNFFLDSKSAKIKARDFTPCFSIANCHKDVSFAIAFAATIGTDIPAAAVTNDVLDTAMAGDLAGHNFLAVLRMIEDRSGLVSNC